MANRRTQVVLIDVKLLQMCQQQGSVGSLARPLVPWEVMGYAILTTVRLCNTIHDPTATVNSIQIKGMSEVLSVQYWPCAEQRIICINFHHD